MRSAEVHLLEAVRRRPPLGMRFHDPVSADHVGDGLVVEVWPSNSPMQRRRAFVTPGGTWVAQGLPGLRAFESVQESDESTSRRLFTVEVEDAWERFLPFSFRVELPRLGLLRPEWVKEGPPPSSNTSFAPALPLFSRATRQPSPGFAIVRAEFWDESAQAPAAGALLVASVGEGPSVQAQADSAGRVTLLLPYPAPLTPTSPETRALPWGAQQWPVSLVARYSPQPASPLAPDLGRTLAQRPARLWSDLSGPGDSLQRPLYFGRELVALTEGDTLSRLRLTPAGSLP
jgi:hypothetical protein